MAKVVRGGDATRLGRLVAPVDCLVPLGRRGAGLVAGWAELVGPGGGPDAGWAETAGPVAETAETARDVWVTMAAR
jgi:hypothetical protein